MDSERLAGKLRSLAHRMVSEEKYLLTDAADKLYELEAQLEALREALHKVAPSYFREKGWAQQEQEGE